MSDRRTLSFIGFGAFARFAAPHLAPHFDVRAHDARGAGPRDGVPGVSLAEAARADVVVLAVPAQNLASVLEHAAPHTRPGALVIDVCSVKMRPLELMTRHLPAGVRIVGTHPLFGPQSGKDGIAGLPIALCRARADEATVECVRSFLAGTLGLRVIETTPQEHDRQMAYVQGLTHFVSRAIAGMDLPATPMSTRAYARLLDMKRDLQDDSIDLFLTIERGNPFAAQARSELLERLAELERKIVEG